MSNQWGFVATLVYEGWADLPSGTSQNRPQPDRVSPVFFCHHPKDPNDRPRGGIVLFHDNIHSLLHGA